MQPRLLVLQRLVQLYGVVEDMHLIELQRMIGAVHEVQQALRVEQEIALSVPATGRAALMAGDCLSWRIAEMQQNASISKRLDLEKVRQERTVLQDAAMEQYVASRLKREQMKRVLNDIETIIEVEKGRRTQAASDDRFLARKRWTDVKKSPGPFNT